MIRWTAAALAISLSMSVYAVDGYKDMKFGTPKAEIQKRKICSFAASSSKTDEPLSCSDFNFGGKKRMAFAYFLDGKFKRFAIVTDVDEAVGVANGLNDKYGLPSSKSTQEEFTRVDTTPGAEASIKFDNDNIIVKLANDESMGVYAMLIYTSEDYEKLYYESKLKSVQDDL